VLFGRDDVLYGDEDVDVAEAEEVDGELATFQVTMATISSGT